MTQIAFRQAESDAKLQAWILVGNLPLNAERVRVNMRNSVDSDIGFKAIFSVVAIRFISELIINWRPCSRII